MTCSWRQGPTNKRSDAAVNLPMAECLKLNPDYVSCNGHEENINGAVIRQQNRALCATHDQNL